MNRDELDGKAKQVKGKVKQSIADLTDDEKLHDEGIADEAEGDVREGFGKARRKVGEAVEDIGRSHQAVGFTRPDSRGAAGDLIPDGPFVIFARFWSALGHPIWGQTPRRGAPKAQSRRIADARRARLSGRSIIIFIG